MCCSPWRRGACASPKTRTPGLFPPPGFGPLRLLQHVKGFGLLSGAGVPGTSFWASQGRGPEGRNRLPAEALDAEMSESLFFPQRFDFHLSAPRAWAGGQAGGGGAWVNNKFRLRVRGEDCALGAQPRTPPGGSSNTALLIFWGARAASNGRFCFFGFLVKPTA